MDTPISQGPIRQWTVDKAITPLKICHWLTRFMRRWPRKFLISDPDELNHYELLPCIDILQGPAPHVVVVKRTIIHEIYEMADSYENGRESMIVLSVSISPIQGGSRLVIETPDTWKSLLETILLELDELPDIVQDFTTINNQTSPVHVHGDKAAAARGERVTTDLRLPSHQSNQEHSVQESLHNNTSNEPQVPQVLLDVSQMKEYYPDYSAATARLILEAIPTAWNDHLRDGRRWGPGLIGSHVHRNSITVGRYLKAFRQAGIEEWAGVRLPK